MEKPLKNTPVFDDGEFRPRSREWPARSRIIIEWSTGTGPHCYVYPAGNRSAGVVMTRNTGETGNDERWADFLEFELVPRIVESLERDDFRPDVICVDLRPLQVQRARRRQIEAAARAKAGAGAH